MLKLTKTEAVWNKKTPPFVFLLFHNSGEIQAKDEEQPLWSLFTSIAKVAPVT